jgi:hypothetical protein
VKLVPSVLQSGCSSEVQVELPLALPQKKRTPSPKRRSGFWGLWLSDRGVGGIGGAAPPDMTSGWIGSPRKTITPWFSQRSEAPHGHPQGCTGLRSTHRAHPVADSLTVVGSAGSEAPRSADYRAWRCQLLQSKSASLPRGQRTDPLKRVRRVPIFGLEFFAGR